MSLAPSRRGSGGGEKPGTGEGVDPAKTYLAGGGSVRDAAHVWRWMRFDVPLRVTGLSAIAIVWSAFQPEGVKALGLAMPFGAGAWIWLSLLWFATLAACVVFVRRVTRSASRPTWGALALEAPFFLVLNPFAEEVFFRGFAQLRLAGVVGPAPALLVVAVAFGFHHRLAGFTMPFLLWSTLGGLLFGAVLVHYSSLVPALFLHSAADVGIFIVGPWWTLRRRKVAPPGGGR